MTNYKHFDITERYRIEHSLNEKKSMTQIAVLLSRSLSSISREIKNHIVIRQTGAIGKSYNNCDKRFICEHKTVCARKQCNHNYCRYCKFCNSFCPDYEEASCPHFEKPPYVCNGCPNIPRCTLRKRFYKASDAQKEYRQVISESRSGISVDENTLKNLDELISPLLKNGQSIHHIYSNNKDRIMLDEKTIYNYVNQGLLSARNMDLPRKVRYRPRKKAKDSFKVDKGCRLGRSMDDYLTFMEEHPDTPVVEMDTVEGAKGGKVLLTLHFTTSQLMLAFLRDANTSGSVIDVFSMLWEELGAETFSTLFPVLLTDNGSEFSNPSAIEFDEDGNRRTRIFYCNPSSPYQKPRVENNHEFIRRIIPKGRSLDDLTQEDINLMMNHINSYKRRKLNDISAIDVFSLLHGNDVIRKLGIITVDPNKIILKPKLLK